MIEVKRGLIRILFIVYEIKKKKKDCKKTILGREGGREGKRTNK